MGWRRPAPPAAPPAFARLSLVHLSLVPLPQLISERHVIQIRHVSIGVGVGGVVGVGVVGVVGVVGLGGAVGAEADACAQ